MDDNGRMTNTAKVLLIGGLIVFVIVFYGTIWIGRSAGRDTEDAVRAVSYLYLDELAGRREQVVESNLQSRINDLKTAVELMRPEDLSSMEKLQDYQTRMKRLYTLDKFAFVDQDGLIYTSQGTQDNIADYAFNYQTISEPEISILNLNTPEKKAIIAVPTDIAFLDTKLKTCFMEIDMREMLSGVSMEAQENEATYCNIYTKDGIALSNTVLGGLSAEDNLFNALEQAQYEDGNSFEQVSRDFEEGRKGIVSFEYKGIRESLSYVPVKGTDWLLTYLIRESVISEEISSISRGIINRSILQSVLTVAAMLIMFAMVIIQNRNAARLTLEKETADAENRARQEEYEQRLRLQEKLLEEEKRRTQQDSMITAMAADYRSVYYVDLDQDDAVCYREDPEDMDQYKAGEHFPYQETFAAYAESSIAEPYREGFLNFIQPRTIREGLSKEPILAYRYLARRAGKEYYEMIRVAGVEQTGEKQSAEEIHAIGLGLTEIDAEMRRSMAQQQALSDALAQAKEASNAKTSFLSSMSHEIRTPMNVIIGLDNIALNDPEVPDKAKDYLKKIGTASEHLLALINDILDMSRIESGRMSLKHEEFSFSKMIEAINMIFSGQAAEKVLEYHCRINGQVDDYYIGDNMKLRQVLINILGNAVKFTPEGGRIDFTVEKKAQFDGKTTISFIISDTGIGMSPEFLPHIFDIFTQEDSSNTSRYGSSGLGMAITKNIVDMMNGNIEVESVKGEGSTFTVTVTLSDVLHKEAADAEELYPEDISVLIVDDDPIACEHAKLVLEKADFKAEIAASGAEAVEMIRIRHARQEPYNLVLVDWKMPEMDGVETTRQIRSIVGHESAVIILTAYRWDDILEEAVQAGVDSFISKPLFASVVLEEFRSAMKKKGVTGMKALRKAELKGRRILLAEDVEINAEIMVMVLETREMQADLAENGRIALEKFESHEPGYYDAILMDMRMPEMDGLEATRRIRALDREDAKKIPIIALTANAFDEDVQRSLQAGLNAHLTKPIQPDVLYETLENLIPG